MVDKTSSKPQHNSKNGVNKNKPSAPIATLPPLDISQCCSNANYQFFQKTSPLHKSKNVAGSLLHSLQSEFSYRIDEFQRGYTFRQRTVYNDMMKWIFSIPSLIEEAANTETV